MTHPHLPETATTTTAVKPPPSPPHPDQPVPMVHANTQNNHTTLVVMSAHYGSQMLINTMVGFDLLVQAYTKTGTITEGQLHAALWPETGLLGQTSTIFGPGVVSYIKDRDVFSIRVGTHDRCLDTRQMQRVVTAIAAFNGTADNNAAANSTVLARRVIYLVCATNTTNLQALLVSRSSDKHSDNTLPLIDYARNLHSYVPDIDEQLAQIATTPHRPMRHGVVASHYQTSTATDHSTHAAVLPAYIGRDGGVCTSSTSTLHYGRTPQSSQHNNSKPDRVITASPAVMCNITIYDLHGVINATDTHGTTVELRTVLDGTGLDGADHTGHAGGDTAVVT